MSFFSDLWDDIVDWWNGDDDVAAFHREGLDFWDGLSPSEQDAFAADHPDLDPRDESNWDDSWERDYFDEDDSYDH